MAKTTYTHEELINICDGAFTPQINWRNRDSKMAHMQLGQCYALIKAGCAFVILPETDDNTIWLAVISEGFNYHDHGGAHDENRFYLPTSARLDERGEGKDWY